VTEELPQESVEEERQALVQVEPPSEAALAKAGVDSEAWKALMNMAVALAKSSLLPPELQGRPADVFVIIQSGYELGLSPMAAVRGIGVIRGKPVFSADLMVGLAKARGLCEYFRCVRADAESATYETKRRGSKPEQLTYTLENAKMLGLLERDNWKKQPANMLRKRAKAALARDVYEDLLNGCYTPDEAQEF